MSERFTVLLDPENAEFVGREADDRDRSKAWIVNEAIRAVRGEVSTYDVNTSEVNTGEVSTLRERLDELEERVASLEAHPATQEGAHAGERGTADGGEGDWTSGEAEREHEPPAASESVAGIGEAIKGVWTDMEHATERRETAVTALEFLREHSEQRWRRKTLKDELWPETKSYDDESDRIWWEKDVMPGLQAAADAGLVEYREGHYDYRWSG